jgi:hypothetical protein
MKNDDFAYYMATLSALALIVCMGVLIFNAYVEFITF